jgi:hypothetical protein
MVLCRGDGDGEAVREGSVLGRPNPNVTCRMMDGIGRSVLFVVDMPEVVQPHAGGYTRWGANPTLQKNI